MQINNDDKYSLERLVKHPRSHGWSQNIDLALLKTKENIHGLFATLPPPGFEPRGECEVCGLGTLQPKELVLPRALHCATVPVVPRDACREALGSYFEMQPDTLCAGGGDADACVGDSGSALSCEDLEGFVLTGVVSWGNGCAVKGEPGVYTDVTTHRQWILNTIFETLENEESNIHILGN
ncbi:tryptase-2-like [Periplaneta americana]|uniref:tryptase-2-like n=1 Tax=Periplaneta americana TaxID=6978 RepID=UPI0037E980FC